jgi:hypothetical protein
MKFRPGTDQGDYQVKLRNLVRFLENGDKAKVTLRFRGREMAHQEIGMELLKRVEADLAELGSCRAVSENGRPADDHGDRPEKAEELAARECPGFFIDETDRGPRPGRTGPNAE